MLQTWTEVSHQISGGWDVEIMENVQKIGVISIEKNVLDFVFCFFLFLILQMG